MRAQTSGGEVYARLGRPEMSKRCSAITARIHGDCGRAGGRHRFLHCSDRETKAVVSLSPGRTAQMQILIEKFAI